MKKILFILLFIYWVNAVPVYAQTPDTYIYQYLSPVNVTGADDLKTKLESEVLKVINAGHLAPFHTSYGKTDPQVDWYHTYDTVYTLSLAYPYVSSITQSKIKTYILNEMGTSTNPVYPIWSTSFLPATVGFRRQPDTFADTSGYSADISARYTDYAKRPKLFGLYALWLYAQNTNDWSYISNNWTNIQNFYSNNRTESSKYYTSLAGAIGMARLAQHIGNTTWQNTAVSDATSGLSTGKNFSTFGTNAENAYFWISQSGDWAYVQRSFYLGFTFIDISPEIGRYMRDDTGLSGLVLGTSSSSSYSLDTAEHRYQLWYLAQAPYFGKVYGEDSFTPPMLKAMIFPIKNWVQKRPSSELRTYLDVPDALVGDYYYMQNLVRTIEASGTECWENIQTTTVECPQSGSTNTPTQTPPSPTPTGIQKPGDADGNGVVDGQDYVKWLTYYNLPIPQPIPFYGDFNKNGTVDGQDYVVWLTNYNN